MKEIVLKLYEFDELSKDSQEKIIERDRWNVMEQCMDAYSVDYKKSMKAFEDMTDTRVYNWEVGYERYDFSYEFKYNDPIDAKREVNPIQHKILDIKSFSLRYLSCLIWDGIQFYGWLWDGSRPIKRSTRESLNACEIYRDKIAFIDYHGNKYDAEYFQRFTQTAEQCRSANKPRIVMLDEEEPPYSVNPTYIRNLQEMSAEAVERLTELKCYSREEAFDIIQDWAKEFTKRYNNYVFDGSYYKMIDTFIEEKLRTI